MLKGGESVGPAAWNETQHRSRLLKLGNLKMIQQQIEERFKEIEPSERVSKPKSPSADWWCISWSRRCFGRPRPHLESRALEILSTDRRQDIRPARIISASRGTPMIARSTRSGIPSNWELSSARATSVVRFFVEPGSGAAGSRLGFGVRRIPTGPAEQLDRESLPESPGGHRDPDDGTDAQGAFVAAMYDFESRSASGRHT